MTAVVRSPSVEMTAPVERVYLSRAERLARRSDYDRLRRRYTVLAELARRFSSDPRVAEPLLFQLAQRIVAPGKLAYAALQEVDSSSELASLPDEIGRLLDAYEARIRPLADEMRQLDQLIGYAREAHDTLDELARTGRGRIAPILGLARRILADVRESPSGRLAETSPGLDLIAAVGAAVDRPAVASCLGGVQVARLLAWFVPQFQSRAGDAELLTTAGLLSSAGYVYWHEARSLPPDQLRRERPADHRDLPRLTAALVGGLDWADSSLPTIVAAIHERLDGTGGPTKATRWRLSLPQRLLQIAARFVELRFGLPDRDARAEGIADIDTKRAARRLWDEAERGRFDATWTRAFLSTLGTPPTARPLDEPVAEPALSEFGRRRLRIDAAHPAISAPHAPPASGAPTTPLRTAAGVSVDVTSESSGPDVGESIVPRPNFLKSRSQKPAASVAWDESRNRGS